MFSYCMVEKCCITFTAGYVIPCLLLKGKGLVKTIKFRNPTYIGDPINAIKIFNDKEVDELVFFDINASAEKRHPNLKLINEIAGECFMPLAYGGGITSMQDIEDLIKIGVEKVIISSHAVKNPSFIQKVVKEFGSSTIVVCLDVKKTFLGNYEIYINNGRKSTGKGPVKMAKVFEEIGIGELIINSIDKDGTYTGYDIGLLKMITDNVTMPVVACGGASTLEDFGEVVKKAAVSAVAAGSLFVFHGYHKAVLINYPNQMTLEKLFKD